MEKEYVGSAKDVKKRINRHLSELKNNRHHNQKLQHEFNRHRVDILDYEVLEEVEIEQFLTSLAVEKKVSPSTQSHSSKFAKAPSTLRTFL